MASTCHALPSRGRRMTGAPIRILIADDHPLFRAGLRALLDSVPDTDVVGEAATGEEAVEAAVALVPDVVVMDINMPGLNGIDATRPHRRRDRGHQRARDDDARRRRGRLRGDPRGCARIPAQGSRAGGDAPRDPVGRERRGDLRAGDCRAPPGLPCRAATLDPSLVFPQLTERELEILRLLAERGEQTPRSPHALFLSRRPFGTTSLRSSRSSRSPTGPRPASSLARQGSAINRLDPLGWNLRCVTVARRTPPALSRVLRVSDPLALSVLGGRDAEVRPVARDLLNRDRVDTTRLGQYTANSSICSW